MILKVADRFIPVALFGGFTVWYMLDAVRASTRVENLILIWPTAIAVLVCLGVETLREVRALLRQQEPERPPVSLRTLGLMALLLLYVLAIPRLGLDVATVGFAAAGCWLMGERRLWALAVYALGMTLVCVLAFSRLGTTPLPLSFPV